MGEGIGGTVWVICMKQCCTLIVLVFVTLLEFQSGIQWFTSSETDRNKTGVMFSPQVLTQLHWNLVWNSHTDIIMTSCFQLKTNFIICFREIINAFSVMAIPWRHFKIFMIISICEMYTLWPEGHKRVFKKLKKRRRRRKIITSVYFECVVIMTCECGWQDYHVTVFTKCR